MSVRPVTPVGTALLTLGLAGCGSEPASARVVASLTTDMAVAFDFQRLDVTTTVDGEVVRRDIRSARKAEIKLPAELPLEVEDGALVGLSLEAYRDGELTPFVTRTALTIAAEGRTPLLPASLEEACSEVSCGAGETCMEGSCGDAFVEPERLAEYDPGWIASAPDACKTAASGEAAIEIGQGVDAFAPLGDGEVVSVEAGAQGGHHVWLALRVEGLRQMGARLRLDGVFPDLDHELSTTTSYLTLRKVETGLCQIWGIRFQVDRGIEMEAIRGQTLDVELTLEDPDGDAATAKKRVVLAP